MVQIALFPYTCPRTYRDILPTIVIVTNCVWKWIMNMDFVCLTSDSLTTFAFTNPYMMYSVNGMVTRIIQTLHYSSNVVPHCRIMVLSNHIVHSLVWDTLQQWSKHLYLYKWNYINILYQTFWFKILWFTLCHINRCMLKLLKNFLNICYFCYLSFLPPFWLFNPYWLSVKVLWTWAVVKLKISSLKYLFRC